MIEVVAERPEGACEGYLPNFAQTGITPGLVRFDAKTGLAKILVANLSATPQTLTPKKPIGLCGAHRRCGHRHSLLVEKGV